MASIKIQMHNSISFQTTKSSSSPHYPLYTFHSNPISKSKIPPLILHCCLSSPSPPTSKEEAILQAKTTLSTTLQKPLNSPKLAGKLKKLKQPRFRVEIPVIDDSPSSISQLAHQVFDEMSLRKKGSPVRTLLVWPNPSLKEIATKAFNSYKPVNFIEHVDLSSSSARLLSSADVAVFLAPEASDLEAMETISDGFYPRPVVIFNPRWGFEEEGEFGNFSGFVRSFEVIYSFMGLEVKGLFSKRQGVVFKCVRDGVLSGEKWNVIVEEDGEMKVVSRLNTRPTIVEVENVLYNIMAVNSPVTKSAKFFKDMVSNVTGKKTK